MLEFIRRFPYFLNNN